MRKLSSPLQIFLWSYVFVYVVFCSLQITQVDLWWQLSEGFHILRTFALPTHPAAAFGFPANPYFDEYAGYEVVLAVLYKVAGFPGLWVVFAGIYLAIIFLPGCTSGQKYPVFDLFSTLALLFAGILMKERLQQRPEIVAALLQVILMVVLRASCLETINWRSLISIFFIFVVWTNTHSTFVIGLFTLGLWTGCEIILKFTRVPIWKLIKAALVMGAAALFATMLNPYGPWRLFFPFVQAFDPGATALSPEMWPIIDFSSTAGILMLITMALLAWALLTCRGVPLWIILFSLFSIYISFRNFRFINLLATSLLFVYAARNECMKTKVLAPSPLLLVALKNIGLSFLCIFMLFGAAFGILFTYGEMCGERHLAAHTQDYAPEISDIRVDASTERVPVLCGQVMGSYLSFDENGHFMPLLDTGLSHFSDDTKRYYFFLRNDPEALSLVLQHLDVNYILLNQETFPWIMTIHRLPDWIFVTCASNGMLWKRNPGVAHPLSSVDIERIKKSEQDILAVDDDFEGAFSYSILLNRPGESLALLSGYKGGDYSWTEPFFDHFCAWVDSLPPTSIREFLASNHSRKYPLVDAILSARLGPETYAKFIQTCPAGYKPWFWKAVAVRNSLAKGDLNEARKIFDTISPVPIASVTYYELWHEVRAGDPKAMESLGAYGRWQTWDDNTKKFMESMSARLNDRIAALKGKPVQ